ncbi:MerR family transcriptional regulator [Oricola indica]|jgi:DNA-binding transcriptional MerR regulator|uniref:MerR family transcriptional regulator n=1 Tax=Oricola indica TaxID=2872591 RepID=UPI001CC03144|nr:MerR family transcriptional regulator [Oricola indica]
MKISDVSARTGLSIDTLRFYEKIGLIDPPHRSGGRRDYDETILAWISFLQALKATGMPLSQMRDYARMRREGVETSAPRRRMLQDQREVVKARIAELQDCLGLLDHKIENYERIEAEHAAEDRRKTGTHR